MAARYILRVDIGTHAVKVSTVDHLGNRIGNIVSNPLTVIERPTVVGFGERVTKNAVMVIDGKQFITRLQDFNHLRSTVLETMKAGIAEAESAGADRASYKGIGTSGAMHTDQPFAGKDDNGILVPIEDDFATMWNSEHNGIEFDMLMNIPGLREMILHATSNEPMQRGILTKMLFRKLNDLNWESTTRFLSANNWITHVLTGSNSFEMSDAISAIDPRTGLYAVDLLKFFGLSGKLPTIVDSEESVGTLLPHVADQLGLSKNVIVAAGGGDQRMALFGNGIVRPGRVALNWGASGTILAHTGGKFDPTGRINTFGPNIPWFMNCCMATGLSLDRFSEASKIAVKILPHMQ
ncbi:MAG: FGGY family carbohydrate kinase [Candidatus Margulisiibacteriota bacterium]